jgi:hypothetical protein
MVLTACAGGAGGEEAGTDGDERVGAFDLALEPAGPPGAINFNAINPNAINPNAINPSALVASALTSSALSATSLSALRSPGADGDLSRQFVAYAVGCALTPSQSFSFSWTDSSSVVHNETYWGLLGLVPTWSSQPLSVNGQQWVSACLASRVNWYGVPVLISSRGNNAELSKKVTTDNEIMTYTHEEGAFWGNLFTVSPAVYTCNHAPSNTYSRSKMRDCSAGHLLSTGVAECGIIHIVGPCSTYCDTLKSSTLYHPSCGGDPTDHSMWTSDVITTFLQ